MRGRDGQVKRITRSQSDQASICEGCGKAKMLARQGKAVELSGDQITKLCQCTLLRFGMDLM